MKTKNSYKYRQKSIPAMMASWDMLFFIALSTTSYIHFYTKVRLFFCQY